MSLTDGRSPYLADFDREVEKGQRVAVVEVVGGCRDNTPLLTQQEVIAKLHLMGLEMTQSTYSKLETNRMNIRVSELAALTKILNVDYNAFFEEIG